MSKDRKPCVDAVYSRKQGIFTRAEVYCVFRGKQGIEYIDWWYKNGDSGKQHYAISYTNVDGNKALFYVDFVIRMKNGQVFLFDTKSEDSDKNAPCKHNALIDYIHNEENADKHLKGGVIIQTKNGENWKYCPMKIENTTDISSWDSFHPDEYKA